MSRWQNNNWIFFPYIFFNWNFGYCVRISQRMDTKKKTGEAKNQKFHIAKPQEKKKRKKEKNGLVIVIVIYILSLLPPGLLLASSGTPLVHRVTWDTYQHISKHNTKKLSIITITRERERERERERDLRITHGWLQTIRTTSSSLGSVPIMLQQQRQRLLLCV